MLNLAHVARKKYKKEETKTNNRHVGLSGTPVVDQIFIWRGN